MAVATLWAGAFGNVPAPMKPARARAVRHLDAYAAALAEGGEIDANLLSIAVTLLIGQGSIAAFWEELGVELRTDMQTAAACLDLGEAGAETTAALLMDMAADVIEAGRP